jgi:DNA mismatch endonuclease (patch repair protein)
MADTFSKEERSKIMRQVKSSRNKSTEIVLTNFFRENQILGWRRNYKLTGKPDFAFLNKHIVVFVDGCFWHGHNCRNTKPSSNKEYWTNKIRRNKQRDKEVTQILTGKGWTVCRIWECDLKKSNKLQKLKLILKE